MKLNSILYAGALALLCTPSLAQDYLYDPSGRLEQVIYADDTTITYTYDSLGNRTEERVTPVPPDPETQGDSEFTCFIATAAYGSHLDPHVVTLRSFRDRHLLTHAPGRALIRFYEHTSPPLAQFIAERPALRSMTRFVLAPLVLTVSHPLQALALLGLGLLLRRRWRTSVTA